MKLYEINIEGEIKYIKSDATSAQVEEAIEFIKRSEVSIDKLLQALRILGSKATELKIEPVDVFEV